MMSNRTDKTDWADRSPDGLVGKLGFKIDRDGSWCVPILRWTEGGCRPATEAEIAMWDLLSNAGVDRQEKAT